MLLYELKEIDDETRLVYEVTNTSRNYDAEVHIECESGSNEYIQFQYSPFLLLFITTTSNMLIIVILYQ